VSRTYERFAGACAVLVALGAIGYAIAFVFTVRTEPRGADYASALFLLGGGLVSTVVMIALYQRLRVTDPSFALLALVLGVVGALGSSIHGGFDLALLAKRPAASVTNFPANFVDPRGLLTFGFTALALLVIAWLIVRGAVFPRPLGYLALVGGALLLIVYLGRLIILNPESPLLLTVAVISGFVVSPLWFLWLGSILWRGSPGPSAVQEAVVVGEGEL
jgi:Domain of unknown function (DUF4386)